MPQLHPSVIKILGSTSAYTMSLIRSILAGCGTSTQYQDFCSVQTHPLISFCTYSQASALEKPFGKKLVVFSQGVGVDQTLIHTHPWRCVKEQFKHQVNFELN